MAATVETASFPLIAFPHLNRVAVPRFSRARLTFRCGSVISDIEPTVLRVVQASQRLRALKRGSSVAVALGSRGIAHIALVGRTVVAALREMGLEPFVVPAMGSHGGGTAEGQTTVLAKLGMTEEYLGAPIRATMETVDYGTTADGTPCLFDANASKASGIIVVNRVKSHTTFDRPIESGLVKMVAVGLGKADGARNVHRIGARGLSDTLPSLARLALSKAQISLGIALVENPMKELVVIEGVEPEDFFSADERLLTVAKSLIARLPFDFLDALVVEKIGKDISGTGMDYAVTARADLRGVPNPPVPLINKIVVLGITQASCGNGLGIGLADFTTKRTVDQIDLRTIYMNSLTSTLAEKSRIPIVLPDDLTAIRAGISTSWSNSDQSVRMCIIRSTLHLDEILVSEVLLSELVQGGKASSIGPPVDLEFASDGTLLTHAYSRDEVLSQRGK
jgi:hypothetical protein